MKARVHVLVQPCAYCSHIVWTACKPKMLKHVHSNTKLALIACLFTIFFKIRTKIVKT